MKKKTTAITPDQVRDFCKRIREANEEAIVKNTRRVAEWHVKFPGKPLPFYLRFNPQRFESYLRGLERKAGLIA
jgi:hypothetical protein